ncbi:NRAM2 protein, partial [Hemiprocne comata]|nr:NRAM2 protein [Hemiprocne comata]
YSPQLSLLFQLPFALIPVLTFTSLPSVMNDFANGCLGWWEVSLPMEEVPSRCSLRSLQPNPLWDSGSSLMFRVPTPVSDPCPLSPQGWLCLIALGLSFVACGQSVSVTRTLLTEESPSHGTK